MLSKQQELSETVAELRHLSQQFLGRNRWITWPARHYGELQEQFRSFQQLMLNKQWEAKQSADASLHDLRLRLDKARWLEGFMTWLGAVAAPRCAHGAGVCAGGQPEAVAESYGAWLADGGAETELGDALGAPGRQIETRMSFT